MGLARGLHIHPIDAARATVANRGDWCVRSEEVLAVMVFGVAPGKESAICE